MAKEIRTGVEITSSFIRLIEIERAWPDWEATNLSLVPMEPGIVSDGVIQNPEMFTQLLSQIFMERKLSRSNVTVSIPRAQVILRLLSTPPLPDWNTREVISSEIEQYAFFTEKEPMFTFQRVGLDPSRTTGDFLNLMVATRADLVDTLIDCFDRAVVELSAVECGTVSLLRLLSSENMPVLYGVLALDETRTDLFILYEGKPRFLRTFDYGYSHFLKRQQRGTLNLTKFDLPEEVLQIRNRLSQEVKSSLNFYQTRSTEKIPVNALYIYVGSEQLEGLGSVLQSALQIDVEYLYAFATQWKLSPTYEVPLALAMRRDAPMEPLELSFLPDQYTFKKKIIQRAMAFGIPVSAVAVLLFLIAFLLNSVTARYNGRLQALKSQETQVSTVLNEKQLQIHELKNNLKNELSQRQLSSRLAMGRPWGNILQDIALRTPKAGWLKKIQTLDEKRFQVTGYTLNQSSAVDFVRSLSGSAYFTHARLIRSETEFYEGKPVVGFEIEVHLGDAG